MQKSIEKKTTVNTQPKKSYTPPHFREIAKVRQLTKGTLPFGERPDSEFCTPGIDCTFAS